MNKRLVILLVIGLLAITAVPVLAERVQPAWQQSFERNTDGWIVDNIAGPAGWCGEITRYERGSGSVAPAKGHGYAVVAHGPCNEYWANNGFADGSGPYSPMGGFSESWPQSGFVTEIDIYLDPDQNTSFTYANSIRHLDPVEYRYFTVPVEKDGNTLLVDGHEVDQEGWYTFRFEFTEQDGHVAVDFELTDNGRILFSEPVTTTYYSGESVWDLAVADYGTGYTWFVEIADGLELPIDHSKYRPGK